MIPRLSLKQRIFAWLLWKLESKHGWGGGWDDDMEGASWLLLDANHLGLSYSLSVLRNYYYIKASKEYR